MRLIQSLPIRLVGHRELIGGAMRLARKRRLSVYDALFLELAYQTGGHLFTCDQKLQKAAAAIGKS
ncbi:type II toxin-antitoxin system VapC family toxin [Methylomarinovum tepidoasis]|uniref:type II toxin-antitoxin system VapC family toxin n=1 Tax=Methylomarinovum tepidoasis TaxID=2840183 RepID=UPI003BF5DB87